MKVLISAFSCNPLKGSESANGWNWSLGLAELGFDVHCLTTQGNEQFINSVPRPTNLQFYYIELPFKLNKLSSLSQLTMYLYYILWQWAAYKNAKKLFESYKFDVIHHISWGSPQLGSFLYRIPVPFIFGPAGGGQKATASFKKYFAGRWNSEVKREKVSKFLLKYNPACRQMIKKAHVILVSNKETENMIKTNGGKNVVYSLDTPLPLSFFPDPFVPKKSDFSTLKLLWVGRFMPRKGLLFILDVMKCLIGQKVHLTVVGDGELMNEVREKIEEDGLQSIMHLEGLVSHQKVRDFYSTHDAFFFTSLRDSGPSQLIEALAFGLPIITIDLHGQAMIVKEEFGFKCCCDTPEIAMKSIKEAILFLIDNPSKLTQMSIAAHAFAENQTLEKKIPQIVQQYYPASEK